jgi:hypothetical protein
LDVLVDMLLNSKFDPEEIEREKGVIVEEMNMYFDTPRDYIGGVYHQLLYGDTPLGWDIIGRKETVRAAKRETFIDYLEPTAAEVPRRVETLVCEDAPSPDNPLGLKGAGEGGVVGCGAAIASAIEDALGMPGAILALPASPAQIRDLVRHAEEADFSAAIPSSPSS